MSRELSQLTAVVGLLKLGSTVTITNLGFEAVGSDFVITLVECFIIRFK